MSKQTLREYYDTNIKNKSSTYFYFHKIKNKMKNGENDWKIKITDEDICYYPAHDYMKIGNVYVTNKEIISIIDFVCEQGLDVDHEEINDEHFLIISW